MISSAPDGISVPTAVAQPTPDTPRDDPTSGSVLLSPASALAETISTYDVAADELAARQWEADFQQYLDKFVHLMSDCTSPIVDAGCGAGRDVAALVSRGFRCVGVDVSSGMLARARDRVIDPRATWLPADMRAIPLETGAAGGVWTNAALLHLDADGQRGALQEFRRLLSPDRPLFVSTLAGSGWTSRHTATGETRWFWGTDLTMLSTVVKSVGFRIVSAETESGVVRGEWVNVLACAA